MDDVLKGEKGNGVRDKRGITRGVERFYTILYQENSTVKYIAED